MSKRNRVSKRNKVEGSASWAWVLGLSVLLGGCTRQAQVHVDDLPVKRVVIYRNGVAYFERAGHVSGEQIQFTLRRENIGDFLATLAILEKGGSTVKAASFPVELDDEEAKPIDPSLVQAMDAWEGKKPNPRPGLRVVTLELDGEEHDLSVGYLAETPVWRPSYRLVVGKGGQAELQAWGIVQNQSGADWTDVEIALVAGAPIAFESDLGDAVIPIRPLVTDSGEIISAVPEGDTAYNQEPPQAAPAAPADYDDRPAEAEMKDEASGAGYGSSAGPKKASRAPQAPAPSVQPQAESASGRLGGSHTAGVGQVRDTSRLAGVSAQTGSTRYDVPVKVTIPDQSATMVLLISKTIPGEAIYLYAPDPGVPESAQHPFRVVRFRNEAGGLLEKGPIAVFEEGAFLGQGLMESLPVKASATVPFALVRGLSVQPEYSYDQRGTRIYAVVDGNLILEVDQANLTTYRVQNGEKDEVKLVVRHPRNPNAKLWNPPPGTDELLDERVALIPLTVPAFGKGTLIVEERTPVQTGSNWRTLQARAAIEDYLANGKPKPDVAERLRKVLALAQGLSQGDDLEVRLTRERGELERASRETRLSIEAIEKNPKAASLRAELTERLRTTTARLDQITKDMIEAGLRRSEQEVRLKEAVQGLVIAPPDQR